MGISTRSDGSKVDVVLEWRESTCANLGVRVAKAPENISIDEDVNWPEEIRTLELEGLLAIPGSPLFALVYKSPQKLLNLRDDLLTLAKPSGDESGKLAGIFATQGRSLNVYFGIRHAGLRTESFTFFSDAKKPDLTPPYLLDGDVPLSPAFTNTPNIRQADPSGSTLSGL